MSKEKEAFYFANADTKIEILRNLIIKAIHGYRAKWKTDKNRNYKQITRKICPIGKFSELLLKNERYILNCVESHWSEIEDKLETSNWSHESNDELYTLFEILQKIQGQLKAFETTDFSGSCNSTVEDPFQTYARDEFSFREEDFNLNLRLSDCDAISVSKAVSAPEVLHSLNNFCIFVNCEMNEEHLTKQLNSICSVDLLFNNKNAPQMNKSKKQNLQLPPFNESASVRKIVDKSFKDLDNIDTLNITSPTAIPLHNNQICYINFSKVWKESRWSTVKQKLIQRGVMESNGMYVVFPIYRQEFIIGRGNFGVVEFGLSRTYHGIALKRLTENGCCVNRFDEIQSVLGRLSELSCENLLKSVAFQDIAGYGFISSRICEYNLAEYIDLVKNNANEWNAERKMLIFQQIIKGLMALHLNNPIIIHGNLKPTNVLMDENGIVKLTEFGLFAFLYDTESQVNDADKIWRANEVDSLQKNCNSMSDIFSLGLLVLFTYTNGDIPKAGCTEMKITKTGTHDINLELGQLLKQMLQSDPVQRPTISEICKHISFWPKERKWQLLVTCISIISHESSTEYLGQPQYTLSNYLESVWHHQNVKTYWISSVFMNLPCTAMSKGARHDSPIDLLKFLVKSQIFVPYLFCEPSVVLQTYPDLPFLIYNALKFKEQVAWETFPNLRSFLV